MRTNQIIRYIVKLSLGFGVFACILLIAIGCSKLKGNKSSEGGESPEGIKYKEYDLDELESLYFSCSHMSRTESFNFSIREQGSKIFLSAWFYPEEGEEIDVDELVVEPNDMETIKAIVGDYGLNNVKVEIESKKKKKGAEDSIIVHDKTSYRFALHWKDGKSSIMGYPGKGGEEIEAFFKNIAETYAEKLV